MGNYRVTPTEELMLLLLAERGDFTYLLNKRHRQTAGSLSQKGLIGFRAGIDPDTILCWLTPKGEKKMGVNGGT